MISYSGDEIFLPDLTKISFFHLCWHWSNTGGSIEVIFKTTSLGRLFEVPQTKRRGEECTSIMKKMRPSRSGNCVKVLKLFFHKGKLWVKRKVKALGIWFPTCK